MEFVYSRMVCSFSDSMIVNSYRFNEYFSYAFNTCLALGAPTCVWVFKSSTSSLLSNLLVGSTVIVLSIIVIITWQKEAVSQARPFKASTYMYLIIDVAAISHTSIDQLK